MSMNLSSIVMVVQVVSALAVVGLVLLQHGKGADMGASFGSGASGSLFGASGSSNFLSRTTGIAAAIFFGATLVLTDLSANKTPSAGVMDNLKATQSAPKAEVPTSSASVTLPAASVENSSAASSEVEIPK